MIVRAEEDPDAVVVYRFVTSQAGNHEIEAKLVYVLAEHGILPRVLGQTESYRCDHFIRGPLLKRSESLDFGPQIARSLADVHKMDEVCTGHFNTTMIE